MNAANSTRRLKPWLYLGLVALLVWCLWAGWHDFNPMIPQDEVRENIRANIRWVVQVLVQFAIPVAILIFLASEAIAAYRFGRRLPNSKS